MRRQGPNARASPSGPPTAHDNAAVAVIPATACLQAHHHKPVTQRACEQQGCPWSCCQLLQQAPLPRMGPGGAATAAARGAGPLTPPACMASSNGGPVPASTTHRSLSPGRLQQLQQQQQQQQPPAAPWMARFDPRSWLGGTAAAGPQHSGPSRAWTWVGGHRVEALVIRRSQAGNEEAQCVSR